MKAYDLVRHDGQVALVLEDLPGSSLRRWIESAHAPLERAARASPCNSLQSSPTCMPRTSFTRTSAATTSSTTPRRGRCTLIDFGIATRLRSEESKFQAPAALEGTLAYIAPEQTGRMNRSLDYRADLYSLGVTLYELFTGALPHDSTDPLEMVHFHIAGKPVPPCDAATRACRRRCPTSC